jgi:hypothetical protein
MAQDATVQDQVVQFDPQTDAVDLDVETDREAQA